MHKAGNSEGWTAFNMAGNLGQSPLASLRRMPDGFSGSYTPLRSGNWRVRLKFAQEFSSWKLTVNAKPAAYETLDDGQLVFYAEGGPDKPLCWELCRP